MTINKNIYNRGNDTLVMFIYIGYNNLGGLYG